MERLQVRSAELPCRVETLRQNLKQTEKCMALFTKKVEALVARIRQETEEIMTELRTIREKLERDINIAVGEAEATIYEDDEPKISRLGHLLRNPNISIDKLVIFSYKAMADCGLPLKKHLIFKLEELGPSPQTSEFPVLAAVFGNKLNMYDLATGTITKSCTLSKQFANTTVFCRVDIARVLCLGGSTNYTKEVHWLNLDENNTITAAAERHMHVGYCGTICVDKCVYVFGGYYSVKFRESEKYSIESNTWSVLSPMSIARSHFSPCYFDGYIYLIDLWKFEGAEKFNPKLEAFTTMQVALPTAIPHCSFNALANREILFLNKDMQVRKWNIETGAISTATFTGAAAGVHLFSNCAPAFMGNKVYFVDYTAGKFHTYDILSANLTFTA